MSKSAKVGTKVKKESSRKKNSCGNARKRILMLQRRYSMLLEERESWEARNREIVENFNREKKANAELQKDIFNWQRLYHEAIIAQNSYKVKLAAIRQTLSICLQDTKSAYPHLVDLSKTVYSNQIRLTELLTSLHGSESDNPIPRTSLDGTQVIYDSSKKSENRTKHKVGPMVKGVLIQKPTIRLERVMLQQPQDQEPANDLLPERENALTPIAEENESEPNLHLERISIKRRRKRRLGQGSRWRMMEHEQENEHQMEREEHRRSVIESSDTDDDLVPVIRIRRLSDLRQSSMLLEKEHGKIVVERGQTSKSKETTSRTSDLKNCRLMADEDPQEGCSWMNVNPLHSNNNTDPKKRKQESSRTSDSSGEESDVVNDVAQKKVRNSLTDSLCKNVTFSVQRKSSCSSTTVDTSHEVLDFSKIEPDSTNNIDELVITPASSRSDSLGMNSISALSNTTSTMNRSQQEPARVESQETSLDVTPAAAVDPSRSSKGHIQSSSYCDNCTPATSPGPQGKRIRKPKIIFDPGEKSSKKPNSRKPVTTSSSKKVLSSRLSAYRKSLGKRTSKNSLELPVSSPTPPSVQSDQQTSSGRASGSSHKKKKLVKPRKSTTSKNPVKLARTSGVMRSSEDQGTTSGSSQDKKKIENPKKSYIKKNSVEKTRTSADMRSSSGLVESEGSYSRRNRGPVSYKEPPTNVKMRRPT